uniref:Putative Beta-lactamase n=1 Tax=mine drainage metagenome TaxID=410659 RepID=E6PXN2_9ZZZZ
MKLSAPPIVLGIVASIFFCCAASSQTTRSYTTRKQRADAVERNLAFMYSLQGQPPIHTTLLQRMAELHIPGVTVAAIHNGHIDWARGYGVAAIGGAAVTPETLFSAESMSKPVTALAVLKLYEQGKIDLDRNVNDYLKRWKLPDSQFPGSKTVTIRQLLTHMSGIGTHNGELYDPSKKVPTLLDDLDGVPPSRTPPVRIEATPGSNFRYANGGYEVLQLLIEDVSGESFKSFVKENVLLPAEMSRSSYDVPLSEQLSSQAATAYLGDHAIPPLKYFNSSPAAGGLWSTATDMAKLLIEVQKEYAGRSSRILKQATIRQMLVPGPHVKPGMSQGLGFEICGKPGAQFMEHGGSGIFRDDMVAYFKGDGLVVMANSSDGALLVDDLLRSASTVYDWPDYRQTPHSVIPFDASTSDKFIGTFGFVKVARSPDGLTAEIPLGSIPQQLYMDRADHFFVLDGPQELFFSDEVNGRMQAARFITPMADTPLKRTTTVPLGN